MSIDPIIYVCSIALATEIGFLGSQLLEMQRLINREKRRHY